MPPEQDAIITLSTDPQVAEQQIEAIIFYLTTCGYIDNEFDLSEKAFVRSYLRKLVSARVDARGIEDAELRFETIEREHEHYVEVFNATDRDVKELFTEAVAEGEDVQGFVHSRLKLRCFELFQGLDQDNRNALLKVVDNFINADGVVHPEELKFRNELAALLEQDVRVPESDGHGPTIALGEPMELAPGVDNHPFFTKFEHHYSADPGTIRRQVEADLKVLEQTKELFAAQRARGAGRLAKAMSTADLPPGPAQLDGFVYAGGKVDSDYELIVVGDLHGCYSCLKSVIMQTNFMEKVRRHRADPENNPDVKLVLLGDYIDRGRFSYNGVLRTVLKLFLTVPEYVYVLRGNHEYYIEYEGRVYGGVRPAEAINTLASHVPNDVFEAYLAFFEGMPNLLLWDGMLFAHAGIPRDQLIRDRFRNMDFLNDADARFQMLWSDPSRAEAIPDDLQAASARFPFGRSQFRAFMNKIGCSLLVRGHEKVNAGFKNVYDADSDIRLLTVFSCGGVANEDLPSDSNYRDVRPMALTITKTNGEVRINPFAIDYRRYQDPERNLFFATKPEVDIV